MYYEVYIDILFLTNFMMDSLLLLAVKKVMHCEGSYARAFVGGAVGSGMTCLIVAVPMPSWIKLILFHLVVNTLMIRIGLNIKEKKEFVKAFFLLYITAFLLGGILQALRPYVRTGSLFFAAAVVSYYLMTFCWKFLIRMRKNQKQICEIILYTDSGEYRAKVLLDTGNLLKDPISKKSVSVTDQAFARTLFPETEPLKGLRYVSYRTIEGESVMPVFRIQKMCICLDKVYWVKEPLIGICEAKISEHEDYQMILNPDILEE